LVGLVKSDDGFRIIDIATFRDPTADCTRASIQGERNQSNFLGPGFRPFQASHIPYFDGNFEIYTNNIFIAVATVFLGNLFRNRFLTGGWLSEPQHLFQQVRDIQTNASASPKICGIRVNRISEYQLPGFRKLVSDFSNCFCFCHFSVINPL